jgi:hypothetical protein
MKTHEAEIERLRAALQKVANIGARTGRAYDCMMIARAALSHEPVSTVNRFLPNNRILIDGKEYEIDTPNCQDHITDGGCGYICNGEKYMCCFAGRNCKSILVQAWGTELSLNKCCSHSIFWEKK